MKKRALCSLVAMLVLIVALSGCGKSKNADLRSLTINQGTLIPSFTPDITEYVASVPHDVEAVTVSGTPTDAYAKVSSPVSLSNLKVGVAQTATLIVIAQNGAIKKYTVAVTRAASSAKAITEFRFESIDATAMIDETDHTIAITVPHGTDPAGLVPIIAHTGASIDPASGTAQDFTNPVIYTVTAADGSAQAYTVTVTVAPDTTPPASVSELTAVAGNAQVTLSWTPPGDEDFSGVEITANPAIPTVSVPKGENTTAITNLTNDISYTFIVKSFDEAGNKSAGATKSATPLNKYVVTYNGNNNTGGSVPTDDTLYDPSATVTVRENTGGLIRIPPAGTAEAYKFGGWNSRADGTGTTYAPGTATFMITEDITLYAKWIKFELRDNGPAGGLIFYDKGSFSDGWRYLEAAPSDYGRDAFGWYYVGGTAANVGTSTAIGAGKNNTAQLASLLSTWGAAKSCANYSVTYGGVTYIDWFLPSFRELEAMYLVLFRDFNYGNFVLEPYWSSSEWGPYGNRAYTWAFNYREASNWTKDGSFMLRFARQF